MQCHMLLLHTLIQIWYVCHMVSTQVALIHSVRERRWEKVMDRELAIEHRIVEFNPFADMEIYRRKLFLLRFILLGKAFEVKSIHALYRCHLKSSRHDHN